jgi:hypothetical protein
MGNRKSRNGQKIYRFALYGFRASGKTCILASMGTARRANPKGYSCTWIENVPGHPLPPGDAAEWKTDDPFHLAWRWLSEARRRIERGEVPRQNPIRELMRFLFDFKAPDRGQFWVELTDYSGELITASTSELASQLQRHMRSCDGILVLAEAPRLERSLTPLSEDFEKLKGAFSILLRERGSGPELDWPVALLFNKWDRRGTIDFQNPDGEDDKLGAFLDSDPDLPHPSLINAIKPAITPGNLGVFPVSAFGMHEMLDDGREVPRRNGSLLQSFRLEDPFVWLVDRRDQLDVEEYEASTSRCSWWKLWQSLLGGSPLPTAAGTTGRIRLTWDWFRGVSPLRSLLAGSQLSRRLLERSDLKTRVERQRERSGYKLGSQLLVLVVTVTLGLLVGETSFDASQCRVITLNLKSPESDPRVLKSGEKWLEDYAASVYRHSLSRLLVLSRERAIEIAKNSKRMRDDKAFERFQKAEDTNAKLETAQEYLKDFPFPSGLHASDAQSWVDQEINHRKEEANLDHIQKVNHESEDLASKPENEDKVRQLLNQLESLPWPNVLTDQISGERTTVRESLYGKLKKINEERADREWKAFQRVFLDLMNQAKVLEAGVHLSKSNLKRDDPRMVQLVKLYANQAVPTFRDRARTLARSRQWDRARAEVKAFEADPQCRAYLGDEQIRGLFSIHEEIGNDQDRVIYEEILRYKPSCRDQISAYMKADIPHRMERHVKGYENYLTRLRLRPTSLVTIEDDHSG